MIDVIDLSYFIVKRTNDNNNPISHLAIYNYKNCYFSYKK